MKNYLILAVLVGLCYSAQAQKAKFKGKVCSIQKATLPTHNIDADKRTYQLTTKGGYADKIVDDGGKLYGWTATEENPHAKAVISVYGFQIGRAKKDSKKKEKKDKDGKVTDSWTEYTYSNQATGLATLYVYGPENRFNYKMEKEKMEKGDKKEEKKANDNPFLTQDIVDEAEESDIGEDAGLADADLTLIEKVALNEEKTIKTKAHRKATDAYKEYKELYDQLTEYRHQFPQEAFESGVASLNGIYGFKPVVDKFWIKRMKTEKHPEYKTWNDAVEATQTIFKTMKFNKPMGEKRQQMQPIVDYFSNQLASISPKDKKAKKHRKAAFNNVLNILRGLDAHDEVISLCDKYSSDKKLDGIAKRFKKQAEYTKAHLAFMNMTERHINTDDVIDEKLIESEELAAEAEEGN